MGLVKYNVNGENFGLIKYFKGKSSVSKGKEEDKSRVRRKNLNRGVE